MSEQEGTTYHIYGRKAYADPLQYVESVTVAAGEQPPVPEENGWVEVVAFPETAVIQVIPRGKRK